MEMIDNLADGLDGMDEIPYYALAILSGLVIGASLLDMNVKKLKIFE